MKLSDTARPEIVVHVRLATTGALITSCSISAACSVFELRTKIEEADASHCLVYQLVFEASLLRDDSTLAEAGITDGAMIDVIRDEPLCGKFLTENTLKRSGSYKETAVVDLDANGTMEIRVHVNAPPSLGWQRNDKLKGRWKLKRHVGEAADVQLLAQIEEEIIGEEEMIEFYSRKQLSALKHASSLDHLGYINGCPQELTFTVETYEERRSTSRLPVPKGIKRLVLVGEAPDRNSSQRWFQQPLEHETYHDGPIFLRDLSPSGFAFCTESSLDLPASDSHLSSFLLARFHRRPATVPEGYQEGYGVVGHVNTGIVIRCPPLQIGLLTEDCIVLYHYTFFEAYTRITGNKCQRTLRASRSDRAHFGDGIYATQIPPDGFGSKDAILINNYTNKTDEQEQERQISDWRSKGSVDYCVPLIVARAQAVDVSIEKTKEMSQPGHTARHNEALRPGRDIWVITIFDENQSESQDGVEHANSSYQLLEHDDWSVRRDAVETLAGFAAAGDQRATAAVFGALRDTDAQVRIAAIWAVADTSSSSLPEIIDRLWRVAEQDRCELVHAAGIEAVMMLSEGENTRGPENIDEAVG